MKYVDENTGDFFTLGALTRYGMLGSTSRLYDRCRGLELPDDIWREYFDRIAALIPGASRKLFRTPSGYEYVALAFNGKRDVPLEPLTKHKDEWFAAIDETVDRIRSAMQQR